MFPIILILTLAAIGAAGKNLPALLISPITSLIHFLGSLIEEGRERLKERILFPEPPSLVRYILSILFTIGSLSWSLMDALMLSASLKIFVNEKVLKMFSTGNYVFDTLINRYLYSFMSIIMVLMISILIHYLMNYLAQKYPHRIEEITGISVAVTVIGLIINLAFTRYYSSQIFTEMSKAVETKNYSVSMALTGKVGLLSLFLFIWGVLCAGICAHLGFNQFLVQTTQIFAGLTYIPLSVLFYSFVLLSKVIEGIQAIIGIPVNIVCGAVDMFKGMFRNKQPDYRIISMIVLLLLGLFLAGCSIQPYKPRLIVAVIDQSCSFKSEYEACIIKTNEIIDALKEEDMFYCLFINGQSYSDKQLLYILPKDGETDLNSIFDGYKDKDDIKKKISDVLNGPGARHSDVLGSLYRVQSIFRKDGKNCEKYLFLFSDLSDNVNKESYALEMDSVNIMVLFANSNINNYISAQNQKEIWQKILEGSKASDVTILEHDLSVSCDLNKYLERR